MKTYLSKWTIARALQLIIGIVFISNYFAESSLFSLVFGGMMFFQAVLNVGCFSSKGCSTNTPKSNETNFSDSDEVEYEIVKD